MIRKFNYTDRVRIRREDISINLVVNNNQNWFDADLSRLANYEFPNESLIFLEAYRQTNWMRFDFGSVGKLTPPKNLHLRLFDSPQGIKFRVKVTASGEIHKLLAEANSIPLITPDNENSQDSPLLDVEPTDELGDEIYKVGFPEDGKPVLYINSELGNYKIIGRSPAFLSLALPAAVREILFRITIIQNWTDDTDMDDWRSRWIKFANSLPGNDDVPNTNDEDRLDWIQDTVALFAKKQKLKAQFKEFWRDEP
ncbi:MAG: hypothetical protein HFACDABA_03221 [Anaerolineales bacterium]|nr:hypothetical protein [Anaerolineales bacterium]